METKTTCGECGAVIPPRSPLGLCPHCLLKQGLTGAASRPASPGAGREPPSIADLQPHFLPFEIIGLMGQGGMGAVYKARDKRLDRLVAIKVIRAADDAPDFSERFLREAQTLARLNHPHIVTVYDVGKEGPFCYLVMELVEGRDLREVLRSGPVPPAEAMRIALSVCDTLEYAHSQGVIHRDIKPGNILIASGHRVKIADFGLAKILDPESPDYSLTLSNESLGTPYYMAPEQRDPSRTADHRADIYSVGVVLHELLTGELPVGSFEPPSRKTRIDSAIDEVIAKAMKTDPDLRYQSAADLRKALEQVLNLNPGLFSLTRSARGRGLSTAIVIAVAVVSFLLGYRLGERGSHPESVPVLSPEIVKFSGHSYKVVLEQVDWFEAERRCVAMGGHLAVVTNKAQNEFLAAISPVNVWLGATDERKKGKWVWLDGSLMTYSNWEQGEPNNAVDVSTGQTENFLMMTKFGKWNDLVSHSTLISGFICEWNDK